MVTCAKRDSHGFLWFCTQEGLSRFDGYTFTNFGVEQGLPDRVVTDFLETRRGDYLVGTARGLVRFNPKPSPAVPMFTPVGEGGGRSEEIYELLEDRQGTVWVGIGDLGVLQAALVAEQWVLRDPGLQAFRGKAVDGFLEDEEGNLWIRAFLGAGGAQLWRRTPSGELDQFPDPSLTHGCGSLAGNRILSMREDRAHNIGLGTYCGLALMVQHPRPGAPIIERTFSRWDRRMGPDSAVDGIFQASDGRLFVGTASDSGTYQVVGDPRGRNVHFEFYNTIGSIELEDGGYFWYHNQKIPRNSFANFNRSDGLATDDVRSVFEGNDGQLYVVTGIHNRFIHRFDGKRFRAVAPRMPGHDASWDWNGWGWGQTHFQDHEGAWWIASGVGLLRYPRVKRLEDLALTPPQMIYRNPSDIFRLYEDSRGDVWIGAWRGPRLSRWQRSKQQIQSFDAWDGEPTSFREDRGGNVWIGRWGGGLYRYHNEKFECVIDPHGAPIGTVNSLFLDHAGRLWAGTSRSGLIRIDDPTAEHVHLTVYSVKERLASNDVRAITEDHFGRIYFWTGKSVDRLSPETGYIRHYTEGDGLVSTGSDHNVAFCDRDGMLWFGLVGLSRLAPEPDPPTEPPPIRITHLSIQGVEHPVSELGEADISGVVLRPNENQMQIDFASLNLAFGDEIRYQYKLDGETDWSRPIALRTVTFPDLSAGTYKFLVRAVNSEGVVSQIPASLSWRVMPPVWRRWWFVTAAGFLIALSIHFAYRYRLQRLIELERVRTRIATDLHDDIGSSLTQIAIMSELAGVVKDDGRSEERLARIADLSREMVDSLSDIVWAINPRRDHLSDLIQRMRRFASELLESAHIQVGFHTSAEDSDTPLQADLRRETFLVFKESLNNIVRHSRCKGVDIQVVVQGRQLVLKICDDGKGFCASDENGRGHGLASMRARAERLGGNLEVNSAPGTGTTLILSVPTSHSDYPRR
jgi:ligand-binding sensor domain-containing protein/signal transduction histidine kinase